MNPRNAFVELTNLEVCRGSNCLMLIFPFFMNLLLTSNVHNSIKIRYSTVRYGLDNLHQNTKRSEKFKRDKSVLLLRIGFFFFLNSFF